MGFFDSKSKSKTKTVSQNYAFSDIAGAASVDSHAQKISTGANSSVHVLDGGAVLGSLEFAGRALDLVDSVSSRNTSALSAQVGQAYKLANEARQSETSGALQSSLKYAAIVLGLFALAWAARKAR